MKISRIKIGGGTCFQLDKRLRLRHLWTVSIEAVSSVHLLKSKRSYLHYGNFPAFKIIDCFRFDSLVTLIPL